MGILPIGFFSPLPLAMMIPFMATQSLAMGEAFGKSFQYGKRKISSMSNEEFNKLTFHDLMVEQTANIKAIVPELNKQMSDSQIMQQAIFREMVDLIPTFFESFKKAIPDDLKETGLVTQASPPPPITNIRYYNDRDNTLQQENIEKAWELFQENFLKQSGTKEELANKDVEAKLLANKLALQEQQRKEAQAQQSSNLSEIQSQVDFNKLLPVNEKLKTQGSEFNIWTKRRDSLIMEFSQFQHSYNSSKKRLLATPNNISQQRFASIAWDKMSSLTKLIVAMSQQYRSPNPLIAKGAIQLRQELASGKWKRKYTAL